MEGEIIAIAVIALIIGASIFYIVKAKKSGRKCIGCPNSCNCTAKKGNKSDSKEGGCCCCHMKDN